MVRTKRLRWSMFWAVVSYFVTTLGTQLTNYLTSSEVTPLQGALISTGVGLGVAMIGVFIDHARDREPAGAEAGPGRGPMQPSGAEAGPSRGPMQPGRPMQPMHPGGGPARTSGRTSVATALVIILLLCGGGGLAITYGAQWVASKATAAFEDLTGKSKANPGQERLAAPVSNTNGVLTITVNSVQVNERATVVELTAQNTGSQALTLSRGFCQLTVPDKPTLEPDQFVGSWGQGDVPGNGGTRNGTIIFDGRLGPETKRVTLAFTTIFGSGFNGPRDIAVDIGLTTVSEP